MSDSDIDDDFDDDFGDDDDAKMVEEAESSVRTRLSSLEKRRLIDNLLEEKRLAKALKDDLWFIVNLKNSELFGYYPQISGSYGGYIPKGKTFEDIAKGATGVKNLGILKADVDNLGLIFSNGFKFNETKVSVSRISNLSKMLDTFFSKFIESSIEHKSLKQGSLGMEIDTSDFYVVYSGGDDLMIVAPWDKLILFSQFL